MSATPSPTRATQQTTTDRGSDQKQAASHATTAAGANEAAGAPQQGFPAPRELPPLPEGAGTRDIPSAEDIQYLIALVEAGPSGGNFQAWIFRWVDAELHCLIDTSRGDYFINYENSELYIGIGAAVATLEIAAPQLGFRAEVEPFPRPEQPELAAIVRFVRGAADPGLEALAEQIPYRISCRKVEDRVPLVAEDGAAMKEIVERQGARLQLVDNEDDLADLGKVVGKMNHMAYLNQECHEGIMRILRWSDEEAAEKRDGILVTSFELTPLEISGLRFICNYSVIKFVNNMGAGRAIEGRGQVWAESSSALGLLTVEMPPTQAFFFGGRALQYLWLEATRRDLAFHVLGILAFFHRMGRGDGIGFSKSEQATLREMETIFRRHFELPEGHVPVLMFRVLQPNAKVDRTYRREVDDVLQIG